MARIPWLTLGSVVCAAAAVLFAPLFRMFPQLLPPCPFKAITGLPCATCGLTRCVVALVAGRWTEAFHWHPVAVLLLAAWPIAATWDLARAWRGRPYPPLPEHWLPRLLAAALLLGTWALQIVRGV